MKVKSTITVSAYGASAHGVMPHFNILLDGKKIGEGSAAATAKDFTFSVDTAADAAHKLQIQYDNDTSWNGQDRNLIINKITLNGHTVSPTDSIVSYDRGALDGRDAVHGQSEMWWNGALVVNADKSFFASTSSTGSTATPTATAPSTNTSGSSASGYDRPFGDNAPWNVTVDGLQKDANSTHLADLFYNHASDRAGNFNLNLTEGFAVYSAKDATGMFKVDTSYSTNIDGKTIPWNPDWKAPNTSDGKVIVLDPDTGREWDLWQTKFDGSTVHAVNGSLVPGDYHTYEGGNTASRGAGIEYLAGLVRPEELAAGKIEHALAMTISNTDGDKFVAPATKLEHPDNPSGGIPEGTRFALDITDAQIDAWAKTLPTAWQDEGHVIATALRDYGWFVTDTSGGAASFEFEDTASAGADYKAMGMADAGNMLDGLMHQNQIYALVSADHY